MYKQSPSIPTPFFFDQKQLIQRPKRKRKQPQELPRSLRFANLNPRLAAFLSSQERQKKKQEAELAAEGLTLDQSNFLRNFSDEAGTSFFALSNTELYRQIFRSSYDNLTLDGEQTQRQLYLESVQAAPTLLVRLTSILYRFQDQHLDLPRELMNCMNYSYDELIAEVQYGNVEWQCLENLPDEQNGDGLEEGVDDDEDGAGGDDGEEKEKKRRRKKKSSAEEPTGLQGTDKGPAQKSRGKETVPGTAKSAPAGRSVGRSGRESGRQSISSRAGGKRAHTADIVDSQDGPDRLYTLEVQRYLRQGRRAATLVVEFFSKVGMAQPSFLQVISFSINKAREETGWLIQREDEDEAVRKSMLETILLRLAQSSQEIKVAAFEAKEKGHTHPLSGRHYGDTKREQMAKYTNSAKKPTTMSMAPKLSHGNLKKLPPAPKLPQPTPGDVRPKFMTGLPDGSMTLYYPSGRLAIITSPSGKGRHGHYTLAYDDNEEGTWLAVFTPTGRGCCYDPKGTIRLWCTEKGGMMSDEDGALTTKWEWPLPHLKLNNPVVYKVNDHMTLRCANRASVTLTFTCHRETAKLHVGQTIMAAEPQTQEELGYLKFPKETYASSSAAESYPPPPPPPKRKKPKEVNVNKRPVKLKPPNPLEEIRKTLEIPNIGEHGIQAELELESLKAKTRHLLDEWMDHYRIALNVTIPQLARVPSASPVTRHKARLIKSAVAVLERSFPDCPKSATDPFDHFLPRPVMPARVPSAPAIATKKSRPFSCVSLPSEKARKEEAGAGRQSRVRIEIDGVDTGHAHSRQSRAASSMSRNTRMSSPQRLMSGKTSAPPETEASGDRQRRTAPLIGCPVALRSEMLGDSLASCKCSRHRIPVITDVELDCFLSTQVPREQLVVLCVVSSMFPGAMPCGEMLVRLFEYMNRNRTKPCYQCRGDRYRLLIYDTILAIQGTTNKQPALYRRHNAVPGMFMIYGGGKLLFCDHIFNGYGNAKKDFQKQLSRTLNDHNMGKYLPNDFRFRAISRGKHGPRSAWGGEIGGPYSMSEKKGVALPGLDDHTGGVVQSSSASSLSSKSQSYQRVVLPPRPHTSGRYIASTQENNVLRRLPPATQLVS